MDLGATVCTPRNPACTTCPFEPDCLAYRQGRVAELPHRAPRKPLPERRVAMLLITRGNEVLLERRPPTGVWGGLWSLPEAPSDGDLGVALASWGFDGAAVEPLAPFEHAFTHFTLEITPWRVQPSKPSQLAAERRATWLPLSDLAGAALPSPIRKLLQRL